MFNCGANSMIQNLPVESLPPGPSHLTPLAPSWSDFYELLYVCAGRFVPLACHASTPACLCACMRGFVQVTVVWEGWRALGVLAQHVQHTVSCCVQTQTFTLAQSHRCK